MLIDMHVKWDAAAADHY